MKKTAGISTGVATAGLGFAVLGLVLSGGFGPCGPAHPGPFSVAILGALLFLFGLVGLLAALVMLVSRRLITFARSHHS